MRPRDPAVLALGGAILAAAVAVVAIHPFDTAPLSFDTASTVAYFDRIASGRHLEAFVTTTSKPLLTAVYGPLHAVAPDWRAISWLVIAIFVLAVAAATAFAGRVAGPLAAVLAAVVLAGDPTLLWDTSLGGGVPWATLLLAAAGLAMTGSGRRPAVAGVLLGLAGLARVEAFVVLAAALAILAAAEVLGRLGRAPRPESSDWLLALGLLAVPLMLLHDWLLTGDPLYFTVPSAAFSAANPAAVLSPAQVVRFLIARYAAIWPLSALAVVGGLALLLGRRWTAAVGLAATGLGIAAFLVLLAWRGTYVSDRYAELIDVAVRFAAAIGFAALVDAAVALGRAGPPAEASSTPRIALRHDALPTALPPGALAIGAALAVVVAVVGSRGWGPSDETLRSEVASETSMNLDLDRVLGQLREATSPLLSAADRALPRDSRPGAYLPAPRLIVPVLLRPRAAVDLELPLWAVASASPLGTDTTTASVASPLIVYHDAGADRPAERYRPYEASAPTRIGSVQLRPLWSDPGAGLWIVRLDPATGG